MSSEAFSLLFLLLSSAWDVLGCGVAMSGGDVLRCVVVACDSGGGVSGSAAAAAAAAEAAVVSGPIRCLLDLLVS